MSIAREEVLTCLASQPLSVGLMQLESFASDRNLIELASWSTKELQGYDSNYPDYRVVTLQYFDHSGQAIPDLSTEYGSWPLLTGIQKLETHLKHGLTLKLPTQVSTFLSQVAKREIFGGYVEPQKIKQVMESVRSEAMVKLEQ